MSTWFNILSRRKPFPTADHVSNGADGSAQQGLARVLNTLDLTALGVGSTLGVGVYVLAGHVAKETAGPGVILSFLIAAIASVFAGLCYAEFGSRVPKAGSAYVYSYVCVGELIAFIIGWNLILEYVIGSASVAKGLSVYIDSLFNNTMKNAFIDIAPIESSFMSDYFDFFSLSITLVLGAALAFGMKESSLANNIFTLINILVVIFVVIAGGINANSANWNLKVNETIREEYNAGKGGFLPFGIEGVIKGAATCFYGFVGFDCIATTGEEVKNPQKAIPISIILSLFIIFLSYFGTSAVVTLMVPYYLQDPDAPIPHAFAMIGWDWARWIVSIGGIFGLCASLFGAMFPLPRIIYAMAKDALVFRFLGTVNRRFRTPVVGTLLAALLTGLMSAIFNLKQLVNMMSIGTLMAYTIVAACVIILRFTVSDEEIADWQYSLLQPGSEDEYSDIGHTYDNNEEYTENLNLIPPSTDASMGTVIKTMFNFTKRNPTYLTQRLVTVLVFVFCVLSLILASLLSYLKDDLENGELYVVIPIGITVICMLVTLLSMYAQPTVNTTLSFKVPLVPLIPALSICINIYLMMMLDSNTWIRFAVWMIIGVPIYLICCKIYYHEKTYQKQIKNGHTNNGFIPDNHTIKSNGMVLTIPDIVVDPPSTGDNKMADEEPETEEETVRRRTISVDSNEFNNAVLEIDKVLDASENDFISNFEAINPDNEFKNSSILSTKPDDDPFGTIKSNQNVQLDNLDNQSICSSSNSEHSKEYHIEVEIHQEDSDEPVEVDEDKNEPDVILNDPIPPESNIPPPPPIQALLDEMANPKVNPKPHQKIKVLPFVTNFELENVALKPVAVKKHRKRTDSTTSEGPIDNVKPGSLQYNKIKNRLDNIFKNRSSLLIPQRPFFIEEKLPSPSIERSLDIMDKVIEQYTEEISEDFGKTKEFKENLSNLLLRRQSNNSNKLDVQDKNIKNVTKINEFTQKKIPSVEFASISDEEDEADDEETEDKTNIPPTKQENTPEKEMHKRLMIATLRDIKLRKTGLVMNEEDDDLIPNQEDTVEDKNESNPKTKTQEITPKEETEIHKRLMIATLRNIKLRRTGLVMNEDNEETPKENISNHKENLDINR